MAMPEGDVLVVDDDPDIAAMISEVLRDEGYTVRTAADELLALQPWRRTTRIWYSWISTSRACRVWRCYMPPSRPHPSADAPHDSESLDGTA
jgi:CheY-like chemotaxis protein